MAITKSLIARVLQILETGFLASLVSGFVVGILARVAMAALTLAGGRSNEFSPLTFTVSGTLDIVTLCMLAGIPIAVLLVIFWRFIPGSGWMKLLWAGVVTSVFPGLLHFTSGSFHLNAATWYYGIALFAPLHFGYGWLAGYMIEALNKRVAIPNLSERNGWARWKIIILPVMFVALVSLYNWAHALTFNR